MTADSPGQSEQAKDSLDLYSSIANANAEFFEPYIASRFSVDPKSAIVSPSLEDLMELMDKSQLVELTLTEVSSHSGSHSYSADNGREPFSLLFCGSHEQPLISAIYTLSHPDLADFNLFLSPVQVSLEHRPEEHPDGRFYEACFS